jgi:hypothetical protein
MPLSDYPYDPRPLDERSAVGRAFGGFLAPPVGATRRSLGLPEVLRSIALGMASLGLVVFLLGVVRATVPPLRWIDPDGNAILIVAVTFLIDISRRYHQGNKPGPQP